MARSFSFEFGANVRSSVESPFVIRIREREERKRLRVMAELREGRIWR